MGQGSAAEAEMTLINTEFWLHYQEFQARMAELEEQDKKFYNYDDNDDPF